MHLRRITSLAIRFWQDESGMLSGADYILAVTILVIGGAVGLVAVRDAMVQVFGDIAVSLESLDQSYTVNYTLASGTVVDFGYVDPPIEPELADVSGQAPHGITLCADNVAIGNEN